MIYTLHISQSERFEYLAGRTRMRLVAPLRTPWTSTFPIVHSKVFEHPWPSHSHTPSPCVSGNFTRRSEAVSQTATYTSTDMLRLGGTNCFGEFKGHAPIWSVAVFSES